MSCPCHRGLWFCLVPAVPPGMYHLVPRCLSSFSHVVGDGIHSGVPSEEFHTLCPARPPAAESGLRHWGFGVWFPWHRRVRLELMAFFSSLLLRVQIYGLFLVIPGRKGSRWSQLGLGRGWSLMHSTHHLLMALAPGLGSALTLSELHPFLSLMRATPEGHTCLLRGAE